ncbi:polysaccharide biosynthesis/export family protein [Jannaschia ovalis]|uniref:Polysaccharide biosynthesis/export family protein n=1 Tax=Jannaschia ovalis TaxID=3038773 RepID=A0ABY8LAH0_9RHOB|nr:polysaccharide biosynthesis/export family protein [Jannaschia sp. GRR-S6-38]WGH77265.1 polysaccharide biosynthesis/export family protein [Jannaschia sp. GRR-S6-38]
MMRATRYGVILLAMWLSACALPRGAGVAAEVLAGPAAKRGFAIVAVTPDAVARFAAEPAARWIGAGGPRGAVIRPGDRVTVTVWDGSGNSLLADPGRRSATLADLPVAPDGQVFLPYVGATPLAGLGEAAARARLQAALSALAPDAQVQLAVARGPRGSVDVLGGVAAPGAYPLPEGGLDVLAGIAAAGGVAPGLGNPRVLLRRGGAVYRAPLADLVAGHGGAARLAGGDTLMIEADDRYFLSIGAAGSEAMHPFPREAPSALDALAAMGGVDAARGNPAGILVLRDYTGAAAAPPEGARIVFTLDLTAAEGLFAAGRFPVRSGDLFYVSESPIGGARAVLSLVGAVFGLGAALSD